MTTDQSDSDERPAETLNNWKQPQILFGRYELPETVYVGLPCFIVMVITGTGAFVIQNSLWTIFMGSLSFILGVLAAIILVVKPLFLRTYEFVRQRTRWLTRQRVRVHDRAPLHEIGAEDRSDGRSGIATLLIAGAGVGGLIGSMMLAFLAAPRVGIRPSHAALAVGGAIVLGAGAWLVRRASADSEDTAGERVQPPNVRPRLGWVLRRMPLLSWFADSSCSERAQDLIPVKRLHTAPHDQFIEYDSDTICAYVVTSPPNLATETSTDSDWERRVEQGKDALSSEVDYYFQYVSIEVPMAVPEYRKAYEAIVNGRADESDLEGMARLRAHQVSERKSLVENDEDTVSERLDLWVATVHPGDLINHDDAASFWGSITNVPVLGKRVEARRAEKTLESELSGDFLDEMRSELRDRRTRMLKALNSVEDMRAERLSIVGTTRALMAHYQGMTEPWNVDDETILGLLSAGPVIDAVPDSDADTAAIETRTDPLSDSEVSLPERLADRLEQNRVATGAPAPDAGRAEYGYDPTPAEQRVAENFRSLVAPTRQRHDDPRAVVLNEREAVGGVWIDGLPDRLTAGAFRRISHDPSINATFAVHASALPRHEAAAEARDEKLNASADANVKGDEWGAKSDRERAKAAADLEETVEKTNSALYISSAYILLRAPIGPDGDEAKHLNEMRESIERKLPDDPSRMRSRPAYYEDAIKLLHTTAPIGDDKLSKHRPMAASGIVKQALHATETFHEPSGVEFGVHDDTNLPLIVDPFARDTGSNMGAFGKIRTGKSTTCKKVANQLKERHPEYDVHWVDPLEGLAGPALTHEASRVTVGGGTGLNIFDVEPPSEEKLDVIGRDAPFQMLMDRFMSLIETYYGLEGRTLEGKMDTWNAAGRETLADFDIVPGEPETLRYDKPTLRDVIRKLGEIENHPERFPVDELESEQSAERRAEIASQIRTEDIAPFLEGGKFAHLAEPTGFDLSDGGGAYLDMQLREAKGEIGLQLGLLLMAVYEQAKRSDNPTVILIDEAHYLLQHADNLEFLEQVIRHSGHYDISVIFSTQNVTDFFEKTTDDSGNTTMQLRDSAKKILDNMSVMMFHHLAEMNEEIADELGLNSDEAEYVRNATPGSDGDGYSEMLLAIDESGERHTYPTRVEMDWRTNPVEFSIVDYDPANASHGSWHDYLEDRLGDRYDQADSEEIDAWTARKVLHETDEEDAAKARAKRDIEAREATADESSVSGVESERTQTTGADTPEDDDATTPMHTSTQQTTTTRPNSPTKTDAISGVGAATADTLAECGIETVSDVIDVGVSGLSEIDGFRHARARDVVAAAEDVDGGEDADADEADAAGEHGDENERAMIAGSAAGGSVSIGRLRSNGDGEGGDD